jgi:hypothetical protein
MKKFFKVADIKFKDGRQERRVRNRREKTGTFYSAVIQR